MSNENSKLITQLSNVKGQKADKFDIFIVLNSRDQCINL